MLSNETYKRRLLRLANELIKVNEDRFFFASFTSPDWMPIPLSKDEQIIVCGSSGCALGLATTMPFFQKLGLTLVAAKQYPTYPATPLVRLAGSRNLYGKSFALCYAAQACKVIFGVSKSECDYLFFPSYYGCIDFDCKSCNAHKQEKRFGKPGLEECASLKEVVDHIRYFVKWKFGAKKQGE